MNKLFSLIVFVMLFAITGTFAQIQKPAPSPSCKITQSIGLIKVDVDYSRPSAKGRKIFGGLVPFGEMWRTGANSSTKITFSDDAKVGGVALPKGTYALYTIPDEKQWTIIFYKNTTLGGVPGDKYKEEDVAAKFTVPAMTQRDLVESFTIGFNNLRNTGGDLEISWEYTKVTMPITLDTDAKVIASIKEEMDGPSANSYYMAAQYYFEEKKDMKTALDWVTKSIEKGGEKFFILRLKSQIQAELGQYKDAIATAERSAELAKAENNADYQRMNANSIAEWKKKM